MRDRTPVPARSSAIDRPQVLRHNGPLAERGAVRLAHRSGGPGVAGSNPAAPTNNFNNLCLSMHGHSDSFAVRIPTRTPVSFSYIHARRALEAANLCS